MNDYHFYFVASQKRLIDGCTPYLRRRCATQEEAIAVAREWAGQSEHGGKYIVYRCNAIGEAQRAAPPTTFTYLVPGEDL
jgi:hypothetical protein